MVKEHSQSQLFMLSTISIVLGGLVCWTDFRFDSLGVPFSAWTISGGMEVRSKKLRRFEYALVFCLCGPLCFAQKLDTFSDCQKKASSQRDLQACADHEFARVEAAMTRKYQQLLSRTKCDTIAENKIRAAQESWLAFRDAQVEAIY